MGLGLGGSHGSSTNTTTGSGTATGTSSGTSDATSTYGSLQNALQTTLANLFQRLLPDQSGVSQNVQALQTAGADQINRAAQGSSDRTTQFLASRGFGQSGQTGQAQLQNELARQSALGQNASAAAKMQLDQNQQTLANALQFAFANPGQSKVTSDTGTTTQNTTETSNSSGTSFGGKVSFGIPGMAH
jgi:hypothetical protein